MGNLQRVALSRSDIVSEIVICDSYVTIRPNCGIISIYHSRSFKEKYINGGLGIFTHF